MRDWMIGGLILAGLLLMLSAYPALAAQVGRASWYGPGFNGRTTASGERFNQYAATCAHRRLKFGTMVRVTNTRTGKAATCRINDRGPYAGGRIIDVSKGIAGRLEMISRGVVRVTIEVLK